ncbi:MAG: hypothetical protein U5M23_15230 [Marinagarivorans sp.]|nr:hypothetical protein [Marinagarivorans sp.]
MGDTCTVKGVVAQSFTMHANKTWVLEGTVLIGKGNASLNTPAAIADAKNQGVTLTVEAGVNVKAQDGSVLIITRGSKLNAIGTKDKPITFSSADEGFDGLGEWKGLVIQGFAPVYGLGGTGLCHKDGALCNLKGEGGDEVGFFGGDNKADNSGELKYVRITETGFAFAKDKEVNGLTLMGVGHGTSLEYIQVHNSGDDGIEWFGGTVNLKHAVLTNVDDDDIDFDMGYKGNIQHVLARKNPTALTPSGTNDPRGIEANSSDAEYVPETDAVLANLTLIGSTLSNKEPGMRLRGAVKTNIVNTAVSAFKTCVQVDKVTLADSSIYGMSKFTNLLGACDGAALTDKTAGAGITKDASFIDLGAGVLLSFNDIWAVTNSQAKLASAISSITPINNGSGFEFEMTDYIGAVDPMATTAWWAGWTIPNSLKK